MRITLGASLETLGITDLWTAEDTGRVGAEWIRLIKDRTASGESSDGKPFKPYSPKYAEEKGTKRVDLRVTGALLDSLTLSRPREKGAGISIKGKTFRVEPESRAPRGAEAKKRISRAKSALRAIERGRDKAKAQRQLARAQQQLARARTQRSRKRAQEKVDAARKRIDRLQSGAAESEARKELEAAAAAAPQQVKDYAFYVNAVRPFMGMTKEEGDKLAQMAADIINAHIDRQVDRASTITTGGGA